MIVGDLRLVDVERGEFDGFQFIDVIRADVVTRCRDQRHAPRGCLDLMDGDSRYILNHLRGGRGRRFGRLRVRRRRLGHVGVRAIDEAGHGEQKEKQNDDGKREAHFADGLLLQLQGRDGRRARRRGNMRGCAFIGRFSGYIFFGNDVLRF